MTEQLDIFSTLRQAQGERRLEPEEERIISLLKEGKENARGGHWLASMVGVSDVKLRELVRHLIDEHGYCIGSRTGEPAGYYLITEESEINEVYRSLRHRGISILVRASKLKRISLEEVFGQGSL